MAANAQALEKSIAYRDPQFTLPYTSDGPESEKLDQGRQYRELLCRLSGTLTIATAAATALLEDAPFTLIKKLEVMVNGSVPIKTLSGKALLELNALANRVLPPFTAPGLTVTNHPFSAFFLLPFWLPDSGLAMDATLLDATRAGGVKNSTLRVNWGAASDMVTPDATTVLSFAVAPSLEVVAHDVANRDGSNFGLFRERSITSQIDNTTSRHVVDLQAGTGRRVLGCTIIAREAGVRSDAIVNDVAIETEDDVRFKMSGAMCRDRTDSLYEVATSRAGVYRVDVAPRGLIGHGAEMSAVNRYDLILDVTAGASSELEIIVHEILATSAGRV